MKDDNILECYKLLKHISKNIRKSVNNRNTASTISRHLTEVNFLIQQLELGLKESNNLSDVVFSDIISTIKFAKQELIPILQNKLKMASPPENAQTDSHFDIRTATAVVTIYDGASDGLQAFVDACDLMKELTSDANQPMLLKFLKTRITGKARQGLPDNINTYLDFISNIKQRCHDTTSPEQILVKLKSVKQRESLDSFCEQIEAISNKLKTIYLEQRIPENVATNMVKKATVEALISGVSESGAKYFSHL